MSLKAGSAFYIMTSARDILFDLFVPALKRRRWSFGVFVLCRYSLRPFAVGLIGSGIRGRMIPFEKGDCRDYGTWLQADRGFKEEQTFVSRRSADGIRTVLDEMGTKQAPAREFRRIGNVLCPVQKE
jgi:hypothetical protein